jgi:hypothetical protein
LYQTKLVILAANFRKAIISEDMVRKGMIISAPSIPLGLTQKALKKLPQRALIHDPLQLGVATMALAVLKG